MRLSFGVILKTLLFGTAIGMLPLTGSPLLQTPWAIAQAQADDDDPPPPPPEDEEAGPGVDEAPPPPDDDGGGLPPEDAADVVPLRPGEAVVTRFSHIVEEPDGEGQPVKVIDINGVSASIVDLRHPAEPPSGQHWINEPQRLFITAGEVGQVFGVTLAERPDKSPDVFLAATSAFGLHRTGQAPGVTSWMNGMWGPDSGPGSIYRISVDTGYLAEKFADVKLDGRQNTGAALGNIAHDRWHGRLFVSDMETGMIHTLDAKTGQDLGHYDHGVSGRTNFLDAWTGTPMALPPVIFNSASTAQTESCSGDFSKTPECWNIADFRRRVWGLSVRQDAGGATRLFYSVWGSDAFGNPDWAASGDDRRNAVWSVAITNAGAIDSSSVRREFFMPGFWPGLAAFGDKAGNSNAVSDIAFADCGPQDVMLVSERGGLRNLGLDKPEPFARPHESRVLRFELGNDNIWRPKGRYDVGFHDRGIKDGEPLLFASASGGADFGYKFGPDGAIDGTAPSQSVWMTGDGLCSPDGLCTSTVTGEHDDASEVHGLQGSPADAFAAVDAPSNPLTSRLDKSYMIDADVNIGADGAPIGVELSRNDATMVGDLSVHQVCEAAPPLTEIDVPDEEILPPIEPPEDWPVHTLRMSHDKWASSGHRVERSWHRREGSWHDTDRSWHWKSQSFHSRNQTWHWREGSWHSKERSWHRKGRSLHAKRYSWHDRDRSWHLRSRSYHVKNRTWGGDHVKGRSYHVKDRTWGGNHIKGRTWGDHIKGRSYHLRGRTWGGDHVKGRSYHVKDRTWSGDHVKGRSYHVKDRTWTGDHVKGRTYHNKGRTWGGDHVKGRTYHNKGKTWGGGTPDHVKGRTFHNKGKTWGDRPVHTKGRTFHKKGITFVAPPEHARKKSLEDSKPVHTKGRTFHKKGQTFVSPPEHARKKSLEDKKPVHTKGRTFHRKGKTFADQLPQHTRQKSLLDKKPRHEKGKTFHVKDKTFGKPPPPPLHRKNRSFHQKANSKFAPKA